MVRIRRCQRCDPGSIPGWRTIIFLIKIIARLAQLVARESHNLKVASSILAPGII